MRNTNNRLLLTAWLSMLATATFFLLGYPLANRWAATHSPVVLTLPLDDYVPFVPLMLLPYLSINLLYPCAFFIHTTLGALRTFSAQLVLAQATCLSIFCIYPTANARQCPDIGGFLGLFAVELRRFDQPYNMMPSLHIAVLVVLWSHPIRKRLPLGWRVAWHFGAVLIAASVLLTWQHYLVDVAAGALVGGLSLVAFPYEKASCRQQMQGHNDMADR